MSDHYDTQGRLLDEPDSTVLTFRNHCIQCGAFISKKPEVFIRSIPVKWNYTYDEQGEITGITVYQEEQEREETWHCKKCGCDHDVDEMYYYAYA